MRGRGKLRRFFQVLALLLCFFSSIARAEETVLDGAYTLEDFHMEEIQKFLDGLDQDQMGSLSFGGVMKEILDGNLGGVLEELAGRIREGFFSEIRTNARFVGQIILLAFIGAVFSGFSNIFGSGHVSETGFYVVYLLNMVFLAASFFASVTIADSVAKELLEFMRVLLPAYFLAVAMAGGAFTSTAVCGFTFGAIGAVQAVVTSVLLPLMRIYMMLVLAGNLYREDMISRTTELLRQGILWTLRTMFGIVVGFHVIQGLVLPQADALRNASAMRLVQMIPGAGAGAGALSQMVMGSGILIKNTAGAAAVLALIFMAAVPVIKLLVLMFLYYIAAAVMQPVCDKRLVACMTGAAAGHGLLLKIVGCSLALFSVTLAVLCISTNAVWYAA